MKELNDRKNEIKADRDSYKTRLEEEREDRKRQDDAHLQHMDMMQNSILVVAQTLKERELQHAKEIDELRKTHAYRAKLNDEECKMTTEISTPKEKQQEKNYEPTRKQKDTTRTPSDDDEVIRDLYSGYSCDDQRTIKVVRCIASHNASQE